MSAEPDMRAKLETAFARVKSEREAKEAAQLAADSVPTNNPAVLRERAMRHAHQAVDEYWGHFNDIQTALDQRVVTPLLQTVARIAAERDEAQAELEKYVGKEPTLVEEMTYLSRCLTAVHDLCIEAKRQATRWENPIPVPEWVAVVEKAAAGERTDDKNDNRHRLYVDGKGNAWISVCSDEGTEWVVPVQPGSAVEQDVRDIADETGSLREIGRCW